MKKDQPESEGKETINMFRIVRNPKEVGSIKLFWQDKQLSLPTKVGRTLILWRTYIDFGYGLRKIVVSKERESTFIEWYVLVWLILLLIFLIVPWPPLGASVIGLFIGWEILGAILIPLRMVLIDRHAKGWNPKSYERSFVFVFVNYFQMIVAFAYFYLHFGLVGYSCTRLIETPQEALYFSVVTITTLGYGDIEPVTKGGQVLVSAEPILGIILLVLVFGILLAEMGTSNDSK